MTTSRYDATLLDILAAFRAFTVQALLISDRDVERATQTVRTADAVGFAIDPTKYREALYTGSLDRQLRLLELFARTKRELLELFPADQMLARTFLEVQR